MDNGFVTGTLGVMGGSDAIASMVRFDFEKEAVAPVSIPKLFSQTVEVDGIVAAAV